MGRTIVIGDVHGCADELDDLLDRVAACSDDRVVMVGDVVLRGPKPRKVLRMARELGAVVVRGNHEWRLMVWRRFDRERERDLSREDRRIVASTSVRRLGQELGRKDWAQIEAMPPWYELGAHGALVVHAGVVPGRPLAQHSERTLMYLRCLDERGEPLEGRDSGVPWGARYQGPPHVLHGHNALSEPQLHPWATGLDTGCVYGGRLTAMVLDEAQPIPADPGERRGLLASVPARRTYVAIR